MGNRLTQKTHLQTNAYTYDIANRLTSVDGVPYAWDAKGNVLDDGESTYTYDHDGRLVSVAQGTDTFSFVYNGLGDRQQQTVNGVTSNYPLDLVDGLTQVLSDGVTSYVYGLERITEQQAGGRTYYLKDALSSVRQLNAEDGEITYAQSYEPFGSSMLRAGTQSSSYGFAYSWDAKGNLVEDGTRTYTYVHACTASRSVAEGQPANPSSFHLSLTIPMEQDFNDFIYPAIIKRRSMPLFLTKRRNIPYFQDRVSRRASCFLREISAFQTYTPHLNRFDTMDTGLLDKVIDFAIKYGTGSIHIKESRFSQCQPRSVM